MIYFFTDIGTFDPVYDYFPRQLDPGYKSYFYLKIFICSIILFVCILFVIPLRLYFIVFTVLFKNILLYL